MSTSRYIALEQPIRSSFVRDSTLVILASLLISLFAKVAIYLPFSPVPIAIQPHIVLLFAVLLGCKRGSLAVLAFLAQGAFGLPVFAGGTCGLAILLGPTGGYLFGYVAAAFITGFLIERSEKRSLLSAFWAMVIGSMCIYFFGAIYLSTFIGFKSAILLGILPFGIGDLLKIVAGVKILQWLGWEQKKI